jgi:Ser/Thr protein kinase RdoA (MazF antagonist)
MPAVDDQQTYLLNGLITRNFTIGRIVRFRQVRRGRQAECYELFTAEEKEYLIQIYPAAFNADQLDFAAGAVNVLDRHRFSVMPFVPSQNVVFVAEGPQNSHMLLSLAPAGSALPPQQYSEHDISQIGLRLGWMHRLLNQELTPPQAPMAPAEQLPGGNGALERLRGLLALPVPRGWVHGDVQPPALLHDSDHQLSAVMDWGLLHWGCPLEDVVDAFLALAVNDKGILDRRRGKPLLEAYATLVPIKHIAWTPVVAHWCARRLIDGQRRALPEGFMKGILPEPERLATALASCV